MLGVQPGATREEIRQAYLLRPRPTIPIATPTAELPTEVIEYLFAMARRINAAHAALNAEQKKQAAAAASRCSPRRGGEGYNRRRATCAGPVG